MRLLIVAVAVGITVTACGSDGSNLGPAASRLDFTVQPGGITAGQAFSPAVQVSVEDASGHVVTSAGTPITLTLEPSSAGATLSGTTTVSASSGVATFADLQISKPGTGYALSASAPGVATATSPTFEVAPAPGVAMTIVASAGQNQGGTVGRPAGTSPAVKVTDGLGSPVANVAVTFEVTSKGLGNVSEGQQTTGPDGEARPGQWTLDTLAGSNTLLASSSGLQGSPVSFTALGSAGPPTRLTSYAGDGQGAHGGTAVLEAPAVLVTDIYGNPVNNVTVTFRVASGGGSVAGAIQTTGSDGIATVGSWNVGERPGRNTLTASVAGLVGSPVTFSATAALGVIVEVRNNYFFSLQNGTGSPISGGTPAVDTVALGETVTWVWVGQGHNVAVLSPQSPATRTHDAPYTISVRFTSTGGYLYRCTNHSFVDYFFEDLKGMRGTIVVR